ncbi:zinc-finger associated domain (zf-AD) domain-containing protein [Phthorimaea operculella]|nr:zinc-finger associated domain (zf-AD) domain-containing protein [Phthorimaea operculella]
MNDFSSFEKTIVRELSCRLCLCTDVTKLKPLSAETKRKLKRLFDIVVRADDTLPKAICHECLQQVSALHLYTVKVDKTQRFLDFYKLKNVDEKKELPELKMNPIIEDLSSENVKTQLSRTNKSSAELDRKKAIPPKEQVGQQGDSEKTPKPIKKRERDMRYNEAMPLEEFAKSEKVDKTMLNMSSRALQHKYGVVMPKKETVQEKPKPPEVHNEVLDTVVLIDGRPAKQGQALDKQITLFYKMECCICHESGFHFRSLMKHYKDRHGVPGYVTCCDKKFHYFYPKKIIEHMACPSCHQNFHTSAELMEHQANGGKSEGKIVCPRCTERFATYHELGWHITSHRSDKQSQCDYCGKLLKHHHRKKTINHMEDLLLCSQCIRTLRSIEKQEKELKEKARTNEQILHKHQNFGKAMGLSCDEDASTE